MFYPEFEVNTTTQSLWNPASGLAGKKEVTAPDQNEPQSCHWMVLVLSCLVISKKKIIRTTVQRGQDNQGLRLLPRDKDSDNYPRVAEVLAKGQGSMRTRID